MSLTTSASPLHKTTKASLSVDGEFLAGFQGPFGMNKTFVFDLNPTDLQISGGAGWKQPETNQGSKELPKAQFIGPTARSLTLKVVIDQFEKLQGDVSADVDLLFSWTRPASAKDKDGGRASAPMLRLSWGARTYFKCYLKSISATYELFSRSGAPLRASVNLTLEEAIEPETGTNPSSGGEGGERRHVVAAGDSLHGIAFRHYGRADLWRALATFNGIDDPLRLATGRSLAIPLIGEADELAAC